MASSAATVSTRVSYFSMLYTLRPKTDSVIHRYTISNSCIQLYTRVLKTLTMHMCNVDKIMSQKLMKQILLLACCDGSNNAPE